MCKTVCLLLLSIVPSLAFSDTGSVSVDDVNAPTLFVTIEGVAATTIWNDLAVQSVPVTSGETGSKVLYMAKVGKSITCASSDDKGTAPYNCYLSLDARSGVIRHP